MCGSSLSLFPSRGFVGQQTVARAFRRPLRREAGQALLLLRISSCPGLTLFPFPKTPAWGKGADAPQHPLKPKLIWWIPPRAREKGGERNLIGFSWKTYRLMFMLAALRVPSVLAFSTNLRNSSEVPTPSNDLPKCDRLSKR